jgi:seryl-tRNA synthetase
LLDIRFIRENPEKVKQNALNKGVMLDLDKLLAFDQELRELIYGVEHLRHLANKFQPVVKLMYMAPNIDTWPQFWKEMRQALNNLVGKDISPSMEFNMATERIYHTVSSNTMRMMGRDADSFADGIVNSVKATAEAVRNQEDPEKARSTLKLIRDRLANDMRILSQAIKTADDFIRSDKVAIRELELEIPNMVREPLKEEKAVGVGDEEANKLLREEGEERKFDFEPKAHWDIGESLGILDTKLAAKLAGSNFALFKGAGAKLVRALMAFMLDTHSANGYVEVWPPVLANREIMTGTGQLPKFEHEMYRFEKDDLFLIPTAEVPLTALHAGEILQFTDLPLNYCAYTPCFRREAGAYGSGTRGLLRVHQFDKVEILKITTQEQAADELDKLLADAEGIIQKLGLRYRVALLSTKEMTFASERTYDIEIWSPGVKRWLEVSSVSSFGAFQARRLSLRYRDKNRKVHFCHTMNGSGVAFARLIACLLETYQREDGTVEIPETLQSYFGCERIEKP